MAGPDAPRAAPPTRDDPGSFRDPSSLVFYRDDDVLRAVSEAALEDFQALQKTSFFSTAVADHRIIPTEEIDTTPPAGPWAGVLRHEPIPFVSYPYEWSFSMLKDAASLHLQLLNEALEEDFTMKDATPYNIQWRGARPTFIDIPSFTTLKQGEPWLGFRQFCQLFLYPLMLRAYKGLPARAWLRGSIDGISAEDMRRVTSVRDRFRKGVMLYVVMQARAERKYAATDRNIREELRSAGFRKQMIQANVRRLRKTIEQLRPRRDESGWTSYATDCAHVEPDRPQKAASVESIVQRRRFRLVWDLGANDGFFSRLAAAHADTVVAMDHDEPVIDRLYHELGENGPANVLPLVVDLADPSPGLGWNGTERRPLEQRGTPDLVLCLALMHHIVIGRNVPPARFLDHLASLGGEVVLEHAGWDDPMVKRLMRNKRRDEVHADYDEALLRTLLEQRFTIAAETPLPSGHRTLLHLVPR